MNAVRNDIECLTCDRKSVVITSLEFKDEPIFCPLCGVAQELEGEEDDD